MSKKSSPLVLQVGKYYRTRDGRKVGPLKPGGILGERSIYVFHCTALNRSWTATGRHNEFFSNAPGDLVAEWTECNPCHERCPHRAEGEAPTACPDPEHLCDAEIVERFNGLVRSGRVQTAVGRSAASYTSLPAECEYRLKPTTRTCTLPDSKYKVEVDGDALTIGCKGGFGAHAMATSLRSLKQDGSTPCLPLELGWGGIVRYPGIGQISGEDADALLKFLEET